MRAADFLRAAGELPVADLDDLVPQGRGVVVVAPHPDDESLGCGGLLAEAVARGRDVRVVVVSDGIGSHPGSAAYPADRLRRLRERETLDAAAQVGVRADRVRFLRLPDRFVPSCGPDADRAAAALGNCAAACRAGAMFVTWRHDPHCDHGAASRLVALARAALGPVRVYEYPVWGWSLPEDCEVGEEPPRGHRLDVRDRLEAKRRAIAAHRSQVSDLIDDDPDGFRLEPAVIARLTGPYEIFLED